jgi:DNA-binding response OmpR family regulator
MRVLVVEDARRLADAIARGLRAEGMAVDVAYDGAVRAVVAAHGRTVGATPIPAGGLRVRVTLPAG